MNYDREKTVRIVERELKRTKEYQQRRNEYGNEAYILGCVMVKGSCVRCGRRTGAAVSDLERRAANQAETGHVV